MLEDLIATLNTEAVVRDIRQGLFHTGVLTRECGLAATLPRDALKQATPLVKEPGSLLQKSVWELARLAHSDSLLEAAIGMATINSLLEVDEKRRELQGITGPDMGTAWMHAFTGKHDKAEQIFQKLKEQNKLPTSFWMATTHLQLGKTEKALEYFEKAYEEHEVTLIWIKWYTVWYEPVRSDPRYKALLKKMGLPED